MTGAGGGLGRLVLEDQVHAYASCAWLSCNILSPSMRVDHVFDPLVNPTLNIGAKVVTVCRGHLGRRNGKLGSVRFKEEAENEGGECEV